MEPTLAWAGKTSAKPLTERQRLDNYRRANGCERITPAQRRRWLKKAMRNAAWDEEFFSEYFSVQVLRVKGHWPNYAVTHLRRDEVPDASEEELAKAVAWLEAGAPGATTRQRPQRRELGEESGQHSDHASPEGGSEGGVDGEGR